MSLSPATRPTESANPRSTRQLLDELDALMDKMLALPVEDEPPPNEPAAATLTMIEPDEVEIPIKRVRQRQAREPKSSKSSTTRHEPRDGDTPAPLWTAGLFDITPVAADVLVSPDVEVAKPAETAVRNQPPPAVATAFRREPPRPLPKSSASWMMGTLVVWDRGFRRMTRRLGPIGWLLRTGVGRILLGLAGLAFWIVALVWLVRDWMQWTG